MAKDGHHVVLTERERQTLVSLLREEAKCCSPEEGSYHRFLEHLGIKLTPPERRISPSDADAGEDEFSVHGCFGA